MCKAQLGNHEQSVWMQQVKDSQWYLHKVTYVGHSHSDMLIGCIWIINGKLSSLSVIMENNKKRFPEFFILDGFVVQGCPKEH